MSGMLSKALAALFKENEELATNAKILGGVAACRIHRREEATNLATGERAYRWCIEFQSEEDASTFDGAIRNIVDAVTEEGRE